MPAGTERTRPFPLTVTWRVVGASGESNVATHVVGWTICSAPLTQAASPLHPRNTDPAAGVGVSTMVVPAGNGCVQFAVQSIPGGLLVTRPRPDPANTIENAWVAVASRSKLAAHTRSAVIWTT